MTFSIQDDKIRVRRLTKADPQFHIVANETLFPRASIEISGEAPPDIQQILANAYERGWIIPIAWASEDQLAWDRLKKR